MQHENIRERDLLVWLESFLADVALRLARARQAADFRDHHDPHTCDRHWREHDRVHAAPRPAAAQPAGDGAAGTGAHQPRSRHRYGGRRVGLRHAQADRRTGSRVRSTFPPGETSRSPSRTPTGRCAPSRWRLSPATPSISSRLRPRLGRLITASDDVAGGPPEAWPVVLSDRYWRERFDADASALGKTIRISGQPVTVIGITPGSFHGVWPGIEPAMYLPLHYMSVISRKDIISPPDSRVGVSGLGRLKPGLSVSDARADLTVHEGRLIEEFEADAPPEFRRRLRLQVESGQTGLPTMFREEYSAAVVFDAGTGRRGAALVLRERQRPDALEAARASARVRGAHGNRRRIAPPRAPVSDRVVPDRVRGRRAWRGGRLVWHPVDAAVLPHADAG